MKEIGKEAESDMDKSCFFTAGGLDLSCTVRDDTFHGSQEVARYRSERKGFVGLSGTSFSGFTGANAITIQLFCEFINANA